ncbi:MAG: hypothetical protein EYC68_21990 [Chloroflexota bacterium]|nr:MAG: hypothetical protein EYC68_21990 [Chloroflexota bacterium]
MTWFEKLTGISETTPNHVRANLSVADNKMTSRANGKEMIWGALEIPSLAELRARVANINQPRGKINVREIVAEVQALHIDTSNANALFQVASQFNLLEMIGPNRTPEDGIGIYENDNTQGPKCAIACGAGTMYRNYFVPVNGQVGQSRANQINCLADIGNALDNSNHRLWKMQNGYALASRAGLMEIPNHLRAADADTLDELRKLLRIGLQWHTQVTLNECTHTVSQAYCSALPVAYSQEPTQLWQPFAQLVLDAAYEATLCAAILNLEQTRNNRVFLTLLGGGAFGNEIKWILQALERALKIYAEWNLDVAIVSYGSSKPMVQELVKQFS